MQCVNTNTREYQALKHRSGLSDSELSHQVGRFLDTVGRYPQLDELDGVNSEPAIREDLHIRKDNMVNTNDLLLETNTSSVEESIQVINNRYRDKEVEAMQIGDTTKVYFTDRPKSTVSSIGKASGEDINSFHYFNEIIDRMQSLYGINIIPITNQELTSPDWQNIAGTQQVKAFVYNGNIYVNTDIATIDSPVHELLHILLGSMKYTNPEIYNRIVESAREFNTYSEISELYPNRMQSDVNEEVFVTELAKYLTNQHSALDNLNDKIKHEIFYNINRTLDTMLMGDASVKCIDANDLYQMSLKNIASLVNASTTRSSYMGALDAATIGRIMSNKKSELMQKGLLREDCE